VRGIWKNNNMAFFHKKPKIIACFAFRYDAQLIPDLLQNLDGIISDYVYHDDRKNEDIWINEAIIRKKLINLAKAKNADWILGIDPDERFEKNAKNIIKNLVINKSKVIYGFKIRELFLTLKYRNDGIWGQKSKFILFPNLPNQEFMSLKVHQQWAPINSDYKKILTDLNLYHLKMIKKQNRIDRRDIYKKLDPNNQIQKIGYDYLADENNLNLKQIPRNREYYPKYNKSYNIIKYHK